MRLDDFKKLPILGILRHIDICHVEPLFKIINKSGLKTIEIALNTVNAFAIIKEFVEISKGRLVIGAGTVLTVSDLKKALDSGATFVVTPVLIKEVADYCVKKNIPFFPGALTPKEIYEAWQSGATMVKVFPASVFSAKYFKEIKGPFEDIKLMAVGGVNIDNIKDYFLCGASAVAFGGSIFSRSKLDSKQFNLIEKDIKKLVDFIKKSKIF